MKNKLFVLCVLFFQGCVPAGIKTEKLTDPPLISPAPIPAPTPIRKTSKIVADDVIAYSKLGQSIALSADGNTAIVGGPNDLYQRGATWVFTRSAGVWSQHGTKLVGTGSIELFDVLQGASVDISSDGGTLIIGGYADNNDVGAAWVFKKVSDSWVQEAKLTGASPIGKSKQGTSVALSADGNTAIVGGPEDAITTTIAGAAWVYIRNAGVWTEQAKLIGSDLGVWASQGTSVALSADGNTAIVGGKNDGVFFGATWVFTRNAGVWSQQGPKLVGAGAIGSPRQGESVSLSSDGDTVIIGGPTDNGGVGATWIFTRSAGVWSQQGPKLVGAGAVGLSNYGDSISLDDSGDTACVGGPADNGGVGATWVFIRNAGVWSQQDKLVGSGFSGQSNQGNSCSLSSDGNTVVIGGAGDSTNTGGIWSFTRNAGVWSQQGSKLVGAGAMTDANQGRSVALSADGNTAIVGGPDDNEGIGASWVYIKLNGEFVKQQKLVSFNYIGNGWQGYAVAISANGDTVAVGAPYDGVDGAVYIFERVAGVWSQIDKLVGVGGVGFPSQGYSISINADGDTLLVGGPDNDGSKGGVWVFTKTAGVWTQEGPKLLGSGAVGNAWQGASTSISNDGNTIVFGGPDDNGGKGATWVFTRSAGIWSQQGAKIVGSGAVGNAWQGASVSLSGSGDTVVIGGPDDSGSSGAAWIFYRNSGVWSEKSKIIGTGEVGASRQGGSVSISSDGQKILISGPDDNGGIGASWFFNLINDSWVQDGDKFVGEGSTPEPYQIYSTSLNSDGTAFIIGVPFHNRSAGAFWISWLQ